MTAAMVGEEKVWHSERKHAIWSITFSGFPELAELNYFGTF